MGRKATLKPHRATERATQRQIGGKHYKRFKIQPIEFIEYCLRDKSGENSDEKWNKIIHYCELVKELKNKK